MNEKTAKNVIFILTILIFSLMILFSIYPSLSYFVEKNRVEGTIVVGEANFEFVNDLPLFLDLKNFKGGKIQQDVSVVNARDKLANDTTNLVDCYLRFKIVSSPSVTATVDMSKFTKKDDYYYFNEIFLVGQSQQLISEFNVSNATENEYLNGIDVVIDVDVMQATKELIEEIFSNAPQEWIDLL